MIGFNNETGFMEESGIYNNLDYMADTNKSVDTYWDIFFQSFNKLGGKEIENRSEAVFRLLKENGVTYSIYGNPLGLNRPWQLDLIPYIITQSEWELIESGLSQRAELFNLILKDIYGEKKLIKNGLLPMELIYRHPGFLRQCNNISSFNNHGLTLYAADMARAKNGKIWIVSDRTQAPSGYGYALENRTAMVRVLPELFNGLPVRRLSPYFNLLNNSLKETSDNNKFNPHVVILTPGSGNETYFEHSYLSSHLGYTLAHGNDLIVKDNYVWLKTIAGLEKVDVIVRRVDDVFCDPLELKQDSHLGVPGLLQVVRSGNVSIANPLGSSILENPGIMPFLENICQHYFGSGLIMDNIASWWCGHPKELKYVLDNLETLVVKRIYRESGKSSSVDGSTLNKAQLEEFKAQIKQQPQLFVGQEKVNIDPTPSLVNQKVVYRNTLFRNFLVNNGKGYTVLAGGLGRTSSEEGNFVISNQLGDVSKDIWVIGKEPDWSLYAQQALVPKSNEFSNAALSSHTAENLLWVGRYTERFLGNARLLRTVIQRIANVNELSIQNNIDTQQLLLKVFTQYSYSFPGFEDSEKEKAAEKLAAPKSELNDVLYNPERLNGIKYNFNLYNNAVFEARDHWSVDTWRLIKTMEEQWNASLPNKLSYLSMSNLLDNLITSTVAFVGLNRESISRDQGWTMLDAGRKLEQVLLLINLLRSTLTKQESEQTFYNLQEAVLHTNECLINYRYKYREHIQLPLVLDLMLLDTNNPRSLMHQLHRLRVYLRTLPNTNPEHTAMLHNKLMDDAHALLQSVDRFYLAALNEDDNTYANLRTFLNKMETLMFEVYNAISKTYFKHSQQQIVASVHNA